MKNRSVCYADMLVKSAYEDARAIRDRRRIAGLDAPTRLVGIGAGETNMPWEWRLKRQSVVDKPYHIRQVLQADTNNPIRRRLCEYSGRGGRTECAWGKPDQKGGEQCLERLIVSRERHRSTD